MFRTWLAILMVMVALCGGTCAEGLFSGASYDAGLAVVNGEVYCAGANIGLGFIPIWRVGMERLEKVRSRIGGRTSIPGRRSTLKPSFGTRMMVCAMFLLGRTKYIGMSVQGKSIPLNAWRMASG